MFYWYTFRASWKMGTPGWWRQASRGRETIKGTCHKRCNLSQTSRHTHTQSAGSPRQLSRVLVIRRRGLGPYKALTNLTVAMKRRPLLGDLKTRKIMSAHAFTQCLSLSYAHLSHKRNNCTHMPTIQSRKPESLHDMPMCGWLGQFSGPKDA